MHKMKVIIGGFGRVGKYLAYKLENAGNVVSIIDKDPKVFDDLNPGFKGQAITGMVFDRGVLESAGITQADAYIAVTSGDNSNIVSARIAREYYKVPKVFARIYDPRRAEIYQGIGIPTIATVIWAGSKLTDLLIHPELHVEYTFGNGDVVLVEMAVPITFENKTVKEIEVTGEIRIASIVRGFKALVPSPTTLIKKDDRLFIAVIQDSMSKLERIFWID
ncbi:MAG: TrkA family potassium uptake protein [Actinobacteria bacterium]|nr:TrkA family potassium uptake protein [Actinomycetota bacterium]MCL5072083.1 TrkA family potassium uptake protein [Actinomycetota bacterium]